MDSATFKQYGYELIDWIADYFDHAERFPVLPSVEPGEIKEKLPASAPETGESMDAVLADFHSIIMPGITHWNHPRFFAYFPANNSAPSVLGELLAAGLGVNSMVWKSSPAATELEEVVMEWLRKLLKLPEEFRGVIQDTASTSTLCALLCAREKATGFQVNARGFQNGALEKPLRVYCSTEAHSSVEKGVKIAGYGAENIVAIDVDKNYALIPSELEKRIEEDLSRGLQPCCVVATTGSTSSTALDPLEAIGAIAKRYNLWLHVDAALAGSAALLPEMRHILNGVEQADSFVFNPHKWLFTNFDCSAFFCRHPELLQRTFAINPEYLKTEQDTKAVNFRDWGIQLGRRFRALKLWFVIRTYGVAGLQNKIREHLDLAQECARWIEESPDFELLAPVPLNTICFRFNPDKGKSATLSEEKQNEYNRRNERLLHRINETGRIFVTHTKLGGAYCLRLSIGQTNTARRHVEEAWRVINECAQVA